MKKKLKVAVIGTGGVSKNKHIPAWATHQEAELHVLCDPEKWKADRLSEQYGIKYVYDDYKDVLAHDDIDIVDICTPNKFHSEIAIAALESGKHVFCEKPDAVNPLEARKMAETAKKSGKHLMVMRNNRFAAAAQFVKRYVEEGHMGDIYTGRCGWIRRRGIPGKGGWFTTKALSGGGPLIDLGVHMLDVSMWLMGNPKPIAITGATYNKFAQTTLSDSVHSQYGQLKKGGTFDVEDLATGFVRFDNGATLHIEFSWASNIEEEDNFYELRGTKSGVSFHKGELKVFTEMAGKLCDIHPRLPVEKEGAHAKHIYHFIDVVQNRTEPINLPEDGVHMIEILSAFYDSAQSGKEIKL